MNSVDTEIAMYQLEVKRYLVEHQFPPADGWEVNIHVDGMERGKGGQQPHGKEERARLAEDCLKTAGAQMGAHPSFGRVDLVATRGTKTVLVEVEGDSRKQKEQKLYSALGQIVLMMGADRNIRYGLAVPDTLSWERQMAKIPRFVRDRLSLTLWLVDQNGVRELEK